MELKRVHRTVQEDFWASEFGLEYLRRNQGPELIASNVALFSRALRRSHMIGSCIEFGASIGNNLQALRVLYPAQEQFAVEINSEAALRLEEMLGSESVFCGSITEYQPTRLWDLVLSKGVLIHVDPESLPDVYQRLHSACGKYLLMAEYYNPTPVSVAYRGHSDRLFKRDFAGELLSQYSDLKLIDYGFVYHRAPVHPQDDLTWFLLERDRQSIGEGDQLNRG